MNTQEEPYQQEAEPSRPMRRDRPSVWSLVVLTLFLLLQVYSLTGAPSLRALFSGSKKTPSTRTTSDQSVDLMTGIAAVDLQAKYAYLAGNLLDSLSKLESESTPSSSTKSAKKTGQKSGKAPKNAAPPPLLGGKNEEKDLLSKSLDDATTLFRSHPTSISLANRVILLRAECGQPPLAALPAKGKTHATPSPLGAFAATPDLSPKDKEVLGQESSLWQTLFASPTIPKNVVPGLAAQIRAVPGLRWWTKLALHQLYLKAGDQPQAKLALQGARTEAVATVIPCLIVVLGQLAAAFIGFILWLVFLLNKSHKEPPSIPQSRTESSLIDTVTPRITNSDRQLGTGDLLNIFVIYLLCLDGVGLVIELGEVHWKNRIENLAPNFQLDLSIALTAVAYVVGSLLAYRVLTAAAVRRGASLASEIGLTVGASLKRNILFGFGGWSMSILLYFIVTALAQWLFRHAPAPANPAIPLLMTATDIFSRVTLLLIVSVAAPFFEETFFRGVFFNALRQRLGPWPAILLTGFMFGFVHPVGIAEVFSLAALGCVFAWMAEKRKSLAPSMTAHCLVNTLTYLTTMFTFLLIQPR